MRVTKALREYAEKEMRAKLDAKIKEIRKPLTEIEEARDAELAIIMAEANEKAKVVMEKYGYEYNPTSYNCPKEYIFGYSTRYYKHPMAEEINNKEYEAKKTRDLKVERFILEMELGGDKEKFFEALAAITLD